MLAPQRDGGNRGSGLMAPGPEGYIKRMQKGTVGALVLLSLAACRSTPVRPGKVDPPPTVQPPRVAADSEASANRFQARTFTLTNPATRDSLREVIVRERAAWEATGFRNYEVTVRVQCFCPGSQEWLVVQVRDGRAESVRSTTGRAIPMNDGNDYSIDRLFDILQLNATRDDVVQVGFDPVAHFPSYIRTDWRLGLPDDWAIFEVRGLQPNPPRRRTAPP